MIGNFQVRTDLALEARELGVTVKLNTEATPETVAARAGSPIEQEGGRAVRRIILKYAAFRSARKKMMSGKYARRQS